MYLIIGGLLLSGCSTAHQTPAEVGLCPERYAPAPALALAFDPAVSAPTPVLDRDVREAAAIGGFEDSATEYYDVQTDDDQVYENGLSTYERRVQSDRVGVIFH